MPCFGKSQLMVGRCPALGGEPCGGACRRCGAAWTLASRTSQAAACHDSWPRARLNSRNEILSHLFDSPFGLPSFPMGVLRPPTAGLPPPPPCAKGWPPVVRVHFVPGFPNGRKLECELLPMNVSMFDDG